MERYLGGDTKAMAGLMRQKDRADWRAKSTYDPMNTRLAQTFAKSLGLSGMFTDKTKTNFAEIAKARAAAAQKRQQWLALQELTQKNWLQTREPVWSATVTPKDESLRLQRQTAKEAIRSGVTGKPLKRPKNHAGGTKGNRGSKKGLANNTGNRQVHNDTITAETERIKSRGCCKGESGSYR